MEKPPQPSDESDRLEALHNLDILDRPSEFRFDRITRLAARSLGTQFSEINLIDENRQWSKSQYGTRERQKPREDSFCAHAILEDDCLVIPDARQDSRFRDNPAVNQFPNIRFYMSFPITSPDGYNLGTLCVFDSEPHSPSQEDRDILKDLAELTEEELTKSSEYLPGLEPASVDYTDVMGDIHHQVRNNMQTILSFLDVQSSHEDSNKEILARAKHRTRTIALVYDCLTEVEGNIEVSMDTYLEELIHDVIQVENPSRSIDFQVDIDPVTISIEQAPVIGLLIHELVSNAVIHGFNRNEKGTIKVTFHKAEEHDAEFRFIVEDSGRGFPSDFDWRSDGGAGMTLIRNITENKFGGTLNCSTDTGVRYVGTI